MIATKSELVIDDGAREMMTGTLRTFAYEAIDAMHCVSEKCGIALSKILIYAQEDSDGPRRRYIQMTACYDTTSADARLLWDTFSDILNSWYAAKSQEEFDFIFANLSTTFRWEN